jgi:dihydroxy-acid dehydratase
MKTRLKIDALRNYGHHFIYKSIGFTDKELTLPRIAVINSWSEQSPGHSHLRAVADGVKAGVRMGGGMPFEINVPGLCTVPGRGMEDVMYDLPQREAVVSAIEASLHVSYCDGWVGIASCDKIIPAMLMAALRLDRPFIFLGGGQMLPAQCEGQRAGFQVGQAIARDKIRQANADEEEALRIIRQVTSCCATSAGACPEFTTGNSMAALTEGLGFALPGSSTSPGVSAEKIWHAKATGEKIVELADKEIKPSHIFTLASLKNAIAVDMAIAGGTNAVVHLQACAHEARIPCTLDDWDAISRQVPAICSVYPSGSYTLYDYHMAGGTPAVMKRIREHLDGSCLTVTGRTVAENLAEVELTDSDVIRALDNPVWEEGAVAVLKGNLTPRGAVTRHTVVENKALLKKTYTARVFDTVGEAVRSASEGNVKPGDIVVCRYQGPRGGPAMTECLGLVMMLKNYNIKDVAVLTDGRFSGWTQGYLAIGHACPEAQLGGNLCILKDGDRIRVDIPARRLDVELSDKEIKARKAAWKPPAQPDVTGVLTIYARLALQADQGAGWPVRAADFEDG